MYRIPALSFLLLLAMLEPLYAEDLKMENRTTPFISVDGSASGSPTLDTFVQGQGALTIGVAGVFTWAELSGRTSSAGAPDTVAQAKAHLADPLAFGNSARLTIGSNFGGGGLLGVKLLQPGRKDTSGWRTNYFVLSFAGSAVDEWTLPKVEEAGSCSDLEVNAAFCEDKTTDDESESSFRTVTPTLARVNVFAIELGFMMRLWGREADGSIWQFDVGAGPAYRRLHSEGDDAKMRDYFEVGGNPNWWGGYFRAGGRYDELTVDFRVFALGNICGESAVAVTFNVGVETFLKGAPLKNLAAPPGG